MSAYASTASTVPSTFYADGTYTYRKVQANGPALPVTVTVHDGCLFGLITGEGADAQECPTQRLAEVERAALAELSWHHHHGLTVRVAEEVAA